MSGLLSILVFLCSGAVTESQGECNEIISYGASFHGHVVNQFGACSGQGECLNGTSGNLFCKCKEGWTGRSDWVNTEGEDCHINVAAIQILWGINMASILFAYARTGPLVYSRWRSLSRRKAAKNIHGGGKNLTLAVRSMNGLIGFYCICMPLLFVIGLVRIIDDNERVGVTVLITTLFLLVKIAFYVSAFLYQPAQLAIFIKSSLKGVSHDLEVVLKISNIGGGVFAFISIGLSFIVIGPMIYPEASSTFYAGYIGGLGLSFVWYGLQAQAIKWRAHALLTAMGSKGDNATSNDLAQAVRARVYKIENEVIGQTVIQLFLFMATVSIAFLYNKHDYYLPVVWLAMITLPYKAARTHISDHDSSEGKRKSRHTRISGTKTRIKSKSSNVEKKSESTRLEKKLTDANGWSTPINVDESIL